MLRDELRAPAERAHDAVAVACRVPPLLCLDDAPQQDSLSVLDSSDLNGRECGILKVCAAEGKRRRVVRAESRAGGEPSHDAARRNARTDARRKSVLYSPNARAGGKRMLLSWYRARL